MRWLLLLLGIAITAAACGSEKAPLEGVGPTPSPTPTPAPQGGTYIALGDSLSSGSGASDKAATSFVALVHQGLGPRYELINLGHSGDASFELLDHGHLNEALSAIEGRNNDGNPNNDVRLVTLEIGGDDMLDLLPLVLGGTCPDVETALSRAECLQRLNTATRRLQQNLDTILSRLQRADDDLIIVLMTVYDPFSGSIPRLSELARIVLEGAPGSAFPEGINSVIRAQARQKGVLLVDLYPLFQGRAGELIADDLIHPNDAGHGALAEAVIEAVSGALGRSY